MLTNRKTKMLGAAAFAAMLAGGGVAGATLGAPIVADAQEDEADADAATNESDDLHVGWHHGHGRGEHLDIAAEALGVTTDELSDALRDDQTIADVAEEQDVDVQSVIDDMVAAASDRITERAEDAIEALPEQMTDLVNGDYPDLERRGGGRGRGPFGGHRHHD